MKTYAHTKTYTFDNKSLYVISKKKQKQTLEATQMSIIGEYIKTDGISILWSITQQ